MSGDTFWEAGRLLLFFVRRFAMVIREIYNVSRIGKNNVFLGHVLVIRLKEIENKVKGHN